MTDLDYSFISSVSVYIRTHSQFSYDICYFIGSYFGYFSDFGRCNLAFTNENYWNSHNPLVRISTAIHAGDPNYYWAQYVSLNSCCDDFLLAIQYHQPISSNYDTIPHISAFLQKIFGLEKDCLDKINLIYQSFKSYKNDKTN